MEGLESHLDKLAADDGVADYLIENFKSVHRYLEEDYYRWVQANCSHFTDHGEHHIKTVISQASALLEEHIEDPDEGELSAVDVYLLLSAIIWHDVGMVKHRAGHEEAVTEFTEEVKRMAFPNPGVQGVIERIVKAHTGGDHALQIPKRKENITIKHRSYTVYSRALAAILRFADELAENPGRVSSSIFSTVPEESKIFWKYSESIKGINPQPRRQRINVDVELGIDDAVSQFICPDKYEDRAVDGEISLIEYIVCRLEKMNSEKTYCAPEFKRFVDISEIDARITILDGDRNEIAEVNEILRDTGLKGEKQYQQVRIFDDFFAEHSSLKPESLEE